jgi:outer membrane protein assembly factor BamB
MSRALALLVTFLLLLAGCGDDESKPASTRPAVTLKSEPSESRGPLTTLRSMDGVQVPTIEVTKRSSGGLAPGFILANARAPKKGVRMGPIMFDVQGRVRWFNQLPADRTSVNLQVQKLDGKKVLTWAERPPVLGPNDVYNGRYETSYMVVADENYRETHKVRVKGVPKGLNALHEFHITPKGTAFIIGFRNIRSARAGNRRVTEGLVQEIDLKTGDVLLDWRSLDHVRVSEAAVPPQPGLPWDYIHLNSVSEDSDGNLLVSARHTHAVYKLDRTTGEVIWTLGGKNSDFKMGRDAQFKYQHDAQRLKDGRLQIFDNAASDFDKRGVEQSRVVRLELDEEAKTAKVAQEITHPGKLLAFSQGNSRVLPNGNLFVGWGSVPVFSEHSADGALLWSAKLPAPTYQSYRGFKGEWKATPPGRPRVVAARNTVYASFNGATDVTHWRVRGGATPGALKEIGVAGWKQLETRITVSGSPEYVQVEALDAAGKVLGRSEPVRAEA